MLSIKKTDISHNRKKTVRIIERAFDAIRKGGEAIAQF